MANYFCDCIFFANFVLLFCLLVSYWICEASRCQVNIAKFVDVDSDILV